MKAIIESSLGVAEPLSDKDFDLCVDYNKSITGERLLYIDITHKLMDITKDSSPEMFILFQACNVESFLMDKGIVESGFSANDMKTITLEYGKDLWCGCLGSLSCEIDDGMITFHFIFSGKKVEPEITESHLKEYEEKLKNKKTSVFDYCCNLCGCKSFTRKRSAFICDQCGEEFFL